MKQQITHIYIRQRRQLAFRFRRIRLYWRHYDRQFGWLWRVINGAAALVLFAGFVAIPVLDNFFQQSRYQLDADSIRLVGNTDSSLASLLTYNGSQQEYIFNQKGLAQAVDPTNPVQALMKAQAAGDKSTDVLYALEVPQDLSRGVKYTDTNTGLSFGLVPEFGSAAGQEAMGHLVYPLDSGNQAIYTLKNNGLKEDIVVPFATSDTMTFSYRFDLPDTLQAKIIPGTGDIGIYSADPSLFGNVSFGSDADQAKVMKARVNSPKDHLVFGLPAPVIKAANGQISNASAKFVLHGSTLQLVASRLRSIHGSFSVDPSVVITSSSDFASGNDEDNIAFGTGQIGRGGLTGGGTSGGWSSTASFTTARYGHASVAYNGYLYIMGGWNGSSAFYNDVQYAPINTDGTVGTWQPTTSFTTTRYGLGAVAYNGYMYIMGGNSGVTNLNDVQYAPINTDGTVGTWQPTTSFSNTRRYFGTVAYNGYIYIMGGTSGTKDNDVQYAPLNADGTVGTWQPTTSFTTARYGLGAVAYNGYLYIIGGYNDTTYYNDVQYAPINTNGTIGTWQSTASFTTARYGLGAIAYNGYLYIGGGITGSTYYNDVQYAPINTNGTIGTWQSTASFTTARYGLGVVAYNGYLYIMGGNNGSNLSDVQYAKIDPAGTAGRYTTSTNTFTTNRRGGQTVVYNGYIYEMGGDAGSTPVSTVYKAAINSDGSIGAFSLTSSFTTSRTFFAAVAYNGYMYVLGGCSSALTSCTTTTNDIATVYKATINSDGTLGTFSNTNMGSITTARYGLAAVAYNGYMYVMGGMNGSTFKNDIQYHAISASDGTMVGSWTTSSRTMQSLAGFGAVVYGGYLYIAGGCNSGSLTSCTGLYQAVYSAPLSSSGDLASSLQPIGNFTTSRFGMGMVITNNYLYIIGGAGTTNVYYSDTQYAQLSTGGTLASNAGCGTTWCSTNSSLATTRYGIGAVTYNGYIYVAGGYNGTYYNNVQIAPINNGGPGTVTSWSATTGFTTARSTQAVATYNGYIYMSGGEDSTSKLLNDVQYAPINNNGTVGSWLTTTNLTSARQDHAMFAYNGYLYTLGGSTSSGNLNTVECAPINSDGTLGSWTATASFTNARSDYVALAYNNYAYIVGGYGSGFYNDVQYAPINSDGTLGSWTATASFTTARDDHDAVVDNGYMYLLGGENGSLLSDVQYAPINSDGTLGSWTATTSLPMGIRAPATIVANGYMYVMGGYTGSYTANVYYAPINAGGTIGAWTATTSFTTGRYYGNAVTYNGYVYILGGNSGGTYLNDVQYAALNSIARVGHYSKLIDLGVSATLQSITYNGTLPTPNGESVVNYRAAANDGVFGALQSAGSITGAGGGGGGCGGGGSGVRYVWVSLTLDDSANTAFPDSTGPHANVTDFTVNYVSNMGHPQPSVRLRGGMFFSGGVPQPLDTCGP